jgi:ABC-2 type transport system permease protein
MVPVAFLRRDLLIWGSYRMAVVWQALGVFVFIVLIYFLGGTLGENATLTDGQSGSFVAFVLSGIAFTDLLMQGLYSIPQAIRDNQKSGTLEPMLLTPIATFTLAFSSSLFRFVLAFGRTAVYMAFGILVLGIWREANPLTLLIVLIPAIATFIAIGALSAAFIVLVKQGDPVLVAYSAITALLGGVFFPIEVFPSWVQSLTVVIPLMHALNGVRAALHGASPVQVLNPVLVLIGMAVVLLPIGIIAFNWAVNRAKMEGSLAQY